MTVVELITRLKDLGVYGVLGLFIAALAVGRLLWRAHHDEVISILKVSYETIIAQLKAHHEFTVADLKRQLEDKDKQIDRWQDMALQQKNLVGKSLDAVVTATVTEKPVS